MKKITLLLTLAVLMSVAIWADQTYFTAPDSVEAGSEIEVEYLTPLKSPVSNRYWITILSPDEADSAWGAWQYVDDGAESSTLQAPTEAGTYEIRLHANYPKKGYNVVQRHTIEVE